MAIQQLYDSLSPLGFYALIVGVAFLLGLFLGWCLWWWKSRQLQQTQELSKAANAEVDQLRKANGELTARVEQAEQGSRAAAAGVATVAGDRHDAGVQSGENGVWIPLDESAALEPLHFVDNHFPDTDWSRVDGVDEKLSGQLAVLGVRNEQQVRSLSPAERRVFDAKLASKGLSWPWSKEDLGHQNVSENMRGNAAGIAGAGIAGAGIAGAGIAGAGVAAGIAAVGLSDLGDDESDQRSLADGDSAAIAAMLQSSGVVGETLDWSSVDGVSPAMADELGRLGIVNPSHVDAMSPEQRTIFDAALATKGLHWPSDSGLALSPRDQASVGDHGELADSESAAVAAMLHLPEVEGAEVDWSTVDGIQPEMAKELQRLGVKNPSHIESLSNEQRQAFNATLAAKGLRWDDTAVSSATSTASASGGNDGISPKSLPATKTDEASWFSKSFLSKTNRLQPPPNSAFGDGGTHLQTFAAAMSDPSAADHLRSSGIATPQQWQNLSPPQRAAIESQLQAKGITLGQPNQGDHDRDDNAEGETDGDCESAIAAAGLGGISLGGVDLRAAELAKQGAEDRSDATSTVGEDSASGREPAAAMSDPKEDETAKLIASLKLPAAVGEKTKWDAVEGIDASCAHELERLGIHNDKQLQELSADERERLQQHLASRGAETDVGQVIDRVSSQRMSPESSRDESSASTSGGARISGFSSGTGLSDERSSQSGVQSGAAGSTSDTPFGSGPTGMGLEGNDGYNTQRLSDLVSSDAQGNTQGNPNEIPVFSTTVPRVKDDLTLLDGINAIEAEELHQMGIHNFDQLHDLSDDDRHRLKAWFRRRGWYLDMDQWRIASEGNTLNPTLEDIQKKAFEVYQYRDREGRHGAENTDWEQAEWSLRGNPIFDYGVPHHVDYFVEAVDGITPTACDELYRMGLYNLQQIQALDLDSRRLLTRWFAGPRFKVDLTSAFGWLSSLETVPQDKDFGFVFTQRPEKIDDLSDINGIGPATERDLNRIGIFHFNQIAHWSESNIQAVCETLNLGDRIDEDLWVVQAQRLAGHAE